MGAIWRNDCQSTLTISQQLWWLMSVFPQARRGVGETFKKWMNLNESPQGWEGVDNKDVRLFSTEIRLDSHHPLLYQSR